MKTSSFGRTPVVLGALGFATLGVLAWSLFLRGGADGPFMPHAHCYLLQRGLILLHGISDFLIGLSYVAISGTLTYLVLRARKEIPFHWMMLAFATFIVACGATHFMEVWTLQTPNPPYWFSGNLKAVTAFASLTTALLLPPLVPKILRLLEEARLSFDRKQALESAHEELERAHERVKQLDQLKTNFFANISHELRTPVTLIVGPVDHLLEHDGFSASARGELQVIRRNALLLHKHVNDLLEISRIEAGKMQVRYVRTDLAKLVRIVASYFSSSSVRPLDLQLHCPESVPLEADAEKIERVLLNLISNAYKFTPDGGIVTVTVGADAGEVSLVVDDSGPGVPPALRESIFERFHQGENPTSRGGTGTGLGLSIVREFTELHGGTVAVGDSPAGGASFRLRLPQRAPADREVRPEESSDRTSFYRSETMLPLRPSATKAEHLVPADDREELPLVLLVEDNVDMSEHIQRTLGGEFRLMMAPDGAAALRLAHERQPDLILSDLMMPGMGGDELLAEVRRDPRLADVPMVLLTARADDEVRLNLLRSGAQDFVLKPFGAEELRVRVRNLVTTKQVRDTLQNELDSQEQDLARLAKEVTVRARELERAKDTAERANRAKDQFLAVLSHELRTPLTPALATAMNLESEPITDAVELRKSLRVIRRNIELEARLIDDLLDITRIARGKLQLLVGDVDAHEAIRHAAEMCQSEIVHKGSQVELDLRAERHYVRADSPRLLQIIWNLLLNAVKFTPERGRIVIRTSDTPLGKLRIEVSDSGIGIDPAVMTRIFEPFEQGEQSVTRRFGGLGIGLAVVKGLVDAHGASIEVSSEGHGAGATFRVEFETIDPPPAPATPPSEPEAPRPRTTHPLRILLVEDHKDTRHAMERLLTRWGHTVTTAGTLGEARQVAAEAPFDLLVSDLGLPDGHGTTLMEELRASGRLREGIAISGFGMEEDIRRSHEAGFSDHLTKPIAAQRLRAIVEQIGERLRGSA